MKTKAEPLSILSMLLFATAAAFACLGLVMVVMGYPAPEWLPRAFGAKSIRKIYQFFLLATALAVLIHPKRKIWINQIFESLTRASQGAKGIFILVAVYAALFTWNQLTAYWSVDINFLPFSFYDYMLYYFWLGKINFTGLLHWWYHTNNLLYILAPFWLIFKNSLFLVILHGPLLALGAWPLFLIARRLFPASWIPLAVAFFYLNFRYLLNLLEMDFLAESFYPLLIFTALYFLVAARRFLFWLSVLAICLIKEDAPFYMCALGGFLLFVKDRRSYGAGAILIALCYAAFLVFTFIPWSGSDILPKTLQNFPQAGNSPGAVFLHYLTKPVQYLADLFNSSEKIKTIFKLLGYTFFLPLLSPWFLMVLVSLLPPFAQGSTDFVNLKYHYSAVVIPFLFFAFLKGLEFLKRILPSLIPKESVLRILFFALLVASGGNYLSHSLGQFQTQTIRALSEIPHDRVLVTQGHLLPYAGYRPLNYYYSWPFELAEHPYHPFYDDADYYFFARSVNSYPYDRNQLEEKIKKLKNDPRFRLVYDDGERVLLERKAGRLSVPDKMLPKKYKKTKPALSDL